MGQFYPMPPSRCIPCHAASLVLSSMLRITLMSAGRGKRNQVRKVLVGIILATLPCYCIGLLIVNLVDSGGGVTRPTATASLAATAPVLTLTASETPTLLPTFTYLFTPTGTASPTVTATQKANSPTPSVTPTFTAPPTAPPPPPSDTPSPTPAPTETTLPTPYP